MRALRDAITAEVRGTLAEIDARIDHRARPGAFARAANDAADAMDRIAAYETILGERCAKIQLLTSNINEYQQNLMIKEL